MNDHSLENQVDRLALMRKGDLREKRREILSLPAMEAMDKILSYDNPLPLVHSFPEEDLYFLVNEIGVEDSLPILPFASSRQLDFILDREIWRKDRMDLNSLSEWMGFMMEADSHRFTNWLMNEKTATLEYFLHHSVEVRLREHDEDPSDFGDDFSTLDNVLYYRIVDEDGKTSGAGQEQGEDFDEKSLAKPSHELVERLIKEMAIENHERYQNIMVEAAAILTAEAEEEAYRWRNVRLSEKGFPPLEEAIEIYAPFPFDQLESLKDAAKKSKRKVDPAIAFSESPFRLMGKETLLSGAMELVSGEEDLNLLQQEFASLCNRIAVADQTSVKTRQDLTAIVEKACGYIQIGLEKIGLMKPQESKSGTLLLDYPVSAIFRLGFGCAMNLKWSARKWLNRSWFKSKGLSLKFWEESWMGVLGGLLIKKPLFFNPHQPGEIYREFQSLEEILRTEKVVEDIIAMDDLLSVWNMRFTPAPVPGFFSYKNLLLTLWARDNLELSDEFKPVSLPAFTPFYNSLWEENSKPRRISRSAKDDFLNFLSRKTGLRNDEIALKTGHVLEEMFKEIEDELGRVSESSLDPRFIRLFLLEKP